MKKVLFFLFAAAVFFFAACTSSETNTPKELMGISLNKQTIELRVDDSYQFQVLYEPEDAEDTAPELQWVSDDVKIARVSQTGKVKGMNIGSTTITATCGKFTAECEVKVVETTSENPETPSDADFIISPESITCPATGGTFTIGVKAKGMDWTVESSVPWATLSTNGNSGSADVIVTVEPTTETVGATADITFTCNKEKFVVTITRLGLMYFSISSGTKAIFSPGNLQYQASTGTWRFAEHQYDYIGDRNIGISSSYSGWIDLFGWGTGNNPVLYDWNESYYHTFTDWGANKISNGGNIENQWRTPTVYQWTYLFSERTNALKLCGRGTVNGVHGFIFLPDNWSIPSDLSFTYNAYNWNTNNYSVLSWSKMELYGAVFLPAAGHRYGLSIKNIEEEGTYWSRNFSKKDEGAYFFSFDEKSEDRDDDYRYYGRSVRLIQYLD